MGASERETLLWLHTFHFMKRVVGERESLTFHHFLDYSGSFSLVARIINTPTSFIFRKCHLYLSKSFKNKHQKGNSCIVANVCVQQQTHYCLGFVHTLTHTIKLRRNLKCHLCTSGPIKLKFFQLIAFIQLVQTKRPQEFLCNSPNKSLNLQRYFSELSSTTTGSRTSGPWISLFTFSFNGCF